MQRRVRIAAIRPFVNGAGRQCKKCTLGNWPADLPSGIKQHVLAFAQADLPDRADQLRLRRQTQFSMQIAGRRSRAKLVEIDAVVDDVHLFRRESAGYVERAGGVRNGQAAVRGSSDRPRPGR